MKLTLLLIALPFMAWGNSSVRSLNSLDAATGWNINAPEAKVVPLAKGWEIQMTKGINNISLHCATPTPLEGKAGRVAFWLYADTGERSDSVSVKFQIRDARGVQYKINTSQDAWSSLKIPAGTWTHVESYPMNARDQDTLPTSVGKIIGRAPSEGGSRPVFPLELVGIDLSSSGKGFRSLQLRSLTYTSLDRRTSQGYWQADGRCLTIEESGINKPFLIAADYAEGEGDYRLSWVITEAKTGTPVSTAVRDFSSRGQSIPALQVIELPLLAPGTYRLKTRVWKSDNGKFGPYREKEDWFLIFRGPATSPSEEITLPSPYHRIVIGPSTPSGIYDPASRLNIPVEVSTQDLAKEVPHELKWRLFRYDRRVISEGRVPVTATETEKFQTTIPMDLSQDDNVFFLEITLDQEGKVVDRAEKRIGFRGIGPQVPDFKATKAEQEPGIFIGMTAMGPKFRDDARYESRLKALREIGIRGIEYAVEWADVEPLPGCFTFAEMDRQLELATQMGFTVILRLRSEFPRYTIPGWVDADYLCQQDGTVSGLLASGPSYSPCDEDWIAAYTNFQQTVARRYASNKAVVAFKVPQNIRESFWIDRPFRYQFTDYSNSAAAGFQKYLQERYGTLEKMSSAYKEEITDWSRIQPPQPYTDASMLNLSPQWVDWMAYKTDFYNRNLNRVLDGLHASAPEQKLYFYSINALTGPPSRETLLAFDKKNAALAAGGSHPIGEMGYTRLYPMGYGLNLMPEPNAYAMPSARHSDDHAGSALEGSAGQGPRMFSHWPMQTNPRDGSTDHQQALVRLAAWNRIFESVPRLRMPQAPVGVVLSWGGMLYGVRGMYSLAVTGVMDKPYRDLLLEQGIESFSADDTYTVEMLAKFPALVLPPETLPIISEELMANLIAYAKRGGLLLMASDSGNITLTGGDKARALLKALGVTGDKSTKETPIKMPVGQGQAWIYTDARSLQSFLRSKDFSLLLKERGGKIYFGSRRKEVAVTLHDGQDGHFYLYAFNGGNEDAVSLTVYNSPLARTAFVIQDILNGSSSQTVELKDEATRLSLPLRAKTAGFFKISTP